ncbi:MAG: secondary thiamine-phosphate synthase enzyme [Myxococcaceae bacterium]|nr:secondary thiamine-phosphate synthase enzyme [Myxococcaceae bacterium]
MRQLHRTLRVETRGKGLYDITREVRAVLAESLIEAGLLTVFVAHTSASLLIQENADPEVQRDLERFFARLVPDGDPLFRHVDEGPDDMPAHVRSALTQTSIGIPLLSKQLALGTWQGIYLYEHRKRPHARDVIVHVLGE